MATAFERLLKVLELEEKQSWRNRAVVGGIGAMRERWSVDAEKEESDPQIVGTIMVLMDQYGALSKEERPACIAKIRQALSGDLSGLEGVLDDIPEETTLAGNSNATARPSVVGTTGQLTKPTKYEFAAEYSPEEENDFSDSITGDPDADLNSDDGDDDGAGLGPAEATNIAREKTRKQAAKTYSPGDLQASTEILSGVGPAIAQSLERIGVNQVIDLIWHLPARYEDYSQLKTISQLEAGEQVTIIANLWEIRERRLSMKRQMVQGILGDGTGTLHATWWNKYVIKQLTIGETMRFSGKVGLYLGQKTLDNPSFEELDKENVATGRISPVYPLTEGLSNKRMRAIVIQVCDNFGRFLSDPMPKQIVDSYDLLPLNVALRQIHFPDTHEKLAAARRRLIFEEFFYIQLGVQMRRNELSETTATALMSDDEVIGAFTSALPFELTGAQQRVLDEVLRDTARTVPMTRLVQGDVGSGKTAVAAAAMYVAASNGLQSALLAPTQILAEQHYRGISTLLEKLTRPDGTPLTIALLTGRVTGGERESVLNGLSDGTIDVVVGTTALIQETVKFDKLAFVVVDEQHRFGVQQRGALSSGDHRAHLLVMSATPIPRSLALTIYGDLDVSVIDELPPGRTPIKTKWFRPPERERLYNFLRREVRDGRQGFIVYPLVEESEKVAAGAAVDEYARLSKEIFVKERLGLLHGRMSGTEKDEVMSQFAAGEFDILVSTSVIEVGIDVPNASLMIIEDAERFGLAQLHQFRGRVGRGQHAGYCALVSKAKGADAEERLTALEESNDGFVLAEKDLELRGPGDFLGTRQSGLPDMRIAQFSDMETLEQARQAAQDLLLQDSGLERLPQLARQVERFWRGHGDIN